MTLNLHELDKPLEPVQLTPGGPEYAFHHIDGISEQLLVATRDAEPEVRGKALYDVLAQCIPDAPRAEIDRISIQRGHVDLLIALAGKAVATVEEYMRQYQGKDETTGEASTSATPSATPSPG